jgi:hypothetical protein
MIMAKATATATATQRTPAAKRASPVRPRVGKASSKPAAKAVAKKPAALPAAAKASSPPANAAIAAKGPVTVSSTVKAHVAVKRDSFTMTASEEALLKQCKRDAIALGRETRKSEVLRAAIQHFAKLSAAERNAAYAALEAIKTGRPKKAKR